MRQGRTALHIKRGGTWTVDDMALVVVGRFLVRSIAADTAQQRDISKPRRTFTGSWFKKKE